MLLMVGLFFIPKLLQRFHIPGPVTEFALGIFVVLFLPQFVTADMVQIVTVFGLIGVITIFLFAGMEVDFPFIEKHKKQIILGVVAQIALVWLLALAVYNYSLTGWPLIGDLGPINALLVALVLVTPSAGFIISNLQSSDGIAQHHKAHHSTRAISAEIVAILLLVLFLELNDPLQLLIIIVALAAVIGLLPIVLNWLYMKLLRKLVNVEFSFFFVIALITAVITEMLGLHFIVGAFVAGLVISKFIEYLVEESHVTNAHSERMFHGMNFLATLFIPFFFFSVGLDFQRSFFQWQIILAAFVVFLVVSIVRILMFSTLQTLRTKRFKNELRMSTALLPTLLFTFIIADLLFKANRISGTLFALLIWYAVFTSLTPIFTKAHLQRVVIPH